MRKRMSRIAIILMTALALCACTDHDSDVYSGSAAESEGGGEEIAEVTAILVLAPYQDAEAASEVEDWGLRLAEATGHAVKVGFTSLPAVAADGAGPAAVVAEAQDFRDAADAASAVKALKPTRVICFKLVAYDDGNAETNDVATSMEGELAAALTTFGDTVAVERVNGFGYGTGPDDFMVKYLKARLDEFRAVIEKRKAAKDVGLITQYVDKLDENLAESVVIVPVEEYYEIITSQQATEIAKLLGVRKVVFVRNEIDLLEWDEHLFSPIIDDIDDALFSNVLSKGHRIVIPYLSSPAEILPGFDRLNTSQINCGRLLIFNSTIIDGDTSFTVLDEVLDRAE